MHHKSVSAHPLGWEAAGSITTNHHPLPATLKAPTLWLLL